MVLLMIFLNKMNAQILKDNYHNYLNKMQSNGLIFKKSTIKLIGFAGLIVSQVN